MTTVFLMPLPLPAISPSLFIHPCLFFSLSPSFSPRTVVCDVDCEDPQVYESMCNIKAQASAAEPLPALSLPQQPPESGT